MSNAPARILELPELLREVALCAGEVAALNLARDFGGTRLYIPPKLNETHKLACSLGLGPALKLAIEMGGNEYLIPLGPFASAPRRRRAIDEMNRDGVSASKTARALGCTERTVYRHRSDTGSMKRKQPDLFKD